MLINVHDAICERRNEFRRKVVLFPQDNARPHVSTMTGWTFYKLEWDLQHPPYSPGMTPSDFYLFSHLHRNGVIFNSNDVDLSLDLHMPQKGLKSC
ncbi:hypothetical protein AVEN_233423-1 [Araneus ventricosus]|uniref:Histone-lysine N-methyltransferase SETMAR n=1 Tax=Araneus ventricosus TaxID=182803 RepID=A0A4Y2WKM9_ARAVE|nr:hypothetical protein AVEN_233423-1 [Araneus ventricosus]